MEMTLKEKKQKDLNFKSLLMLLRKIGGTFPGKCGCGKTISANKAKCFACSQKAEVPK